jgi:hypothetical protein
MKMPAWFATKLYTCDDFGAIGTIAVVGETMPAWKSSEWVIVPSLTMVMLKVSPIFPRYTGPGTWPSKVHIICSTPGAISSFFSTMCIVMLCTVPGSGAGACGSRALNPSGGSAAKSIF